MKQKPESLAHASSSFFQRETATDAQRTSLESLIGSLPGDVLLKPLAQSSSNPSALWSLTQPSDVLTQLLEQLSPAERMRLMQNEDNLSGKSMDHP